MAAKHLFAASVLGLFRSLADNTATLDALDALDARTGLTPRAARISADAMVALGLFERDGDTYRNSQPRPRSCPVPVRPTCGPSCGSGTMRTPSASPAPASRPSSPAPPPPPSPPTRAWTAAPATGWAFAAHRPLAGPFSAIWADAVRAPVG